MDYLIHHMLLHSAARDPQGEALVGSRQRLTYSEYAAETARLAAAYQAAGIVRGDRIGIWLETSVDQAMAIFSVSRAGGVFVPISHHLFPEQVAHIVNDCQIKALITTKAKCAALESVMSSLPSIEWIGLTDGESEVDAGTAKVLSLREMATSAPVGEGKDCRIEKDLAAILYTSGSTGKPKGVMLSHGQVMAGSLIVSSYLNITNRDRIVGALPLSFDAGMNQLMTAVQQGGCYLPLNFIFAREIVQWLIKERVTGMAGVPTLWSLMAQPSSTLEKQRLPDLRYITNTGGRMPLEVLAQLRGLLPTTKVFLMYGLTEAFRSTYLPPEELDRRPDSMGQAIPNTEIIVVNDKGERCRPGEVGELVHRGPTVSMGYWGLPELTAKVLRQHPFAPPELGDSETVCYSGDLVKMDEDGFLYFVGRRDNMIKSSGFRVSPSEVEEVLFQSGKLREAAVIGIADATLGQAIKAFVVPREGETVNGEELTAHCAAKLPRYMIPKAVVVRETLPKTSSGKVDYQSLRLLDKQ